MGKNQGGGVINMGFEKQSGRRRGIGVKGFGEGKLSETNGLHIQACRGDHSGDQGGGGVRVILKL